MPIRRSAYNRLPDSILQELKECDSNESMFADIISGFVALLVLWVVHLSIGIGYQFYSALDNSVTEIASEYVECAWDKTLDGLSQLGLDL